MAYKEAYLYYYKKGHHGRVNSTGQMQLGSNLRNEYDLQQEIQPIVDNQNLSQNEKNVLIEAIREPMSIDKKNEKQNIKESTKIAKVINDANISNSEKLALMLTISNNGYNIQKAMENISNQEKQTVKTENKPVLQNEQQTTQEEAQMPQNATSQEISENVGINQNIENVVPEEQQAIQELSDGSEQAIAEEIPQDIISEQVEPSNATNEDTQAFEQNMQENLYTDKKQRSLPISSLQNPNTSKQLKKETKTDIIETEAGQYVERTNEKTIEKAQKNLETVGFDRSFDEFNTKYEKDEKITLDDMAEGLLMIQHYDSIGDREKAKTLLKNMSVIATETGQMIQILSLMKKVLPEARVDIARKVIERFNKKNDTDIVINEKLVNELEKAEQEGAEENVLDEKMNDILKDAINQTKLSVWEKLDNWRYLAMLGNPKTWIKNSLGNTLNRQVYKNKNFAKGVIEDVIGTFWKGYVKDTTIKLATKQQKEYAHKRAVELGENIDNSGSKYANNPTNQMKAMKRKFDSKFFNMLAEGTENILSGADTKALIKMYENAFSKFMSANNLTEKDLDILESDDAKTVKEKQKWLNRADEYATWQAKEATFHQASALANWLNNLDRATMQDDSFGKVFVGVLAKGLLPFRRTPFNMLKQSVDYSPAGVVRGLTGLARDALKEGSKLEQQLKEGKITQDDYNYKFSQMLNKRLDQFSKGATGTINGSIIGYVLSSMGIISVGNLDDDDKYEEQLGKQKYSINILGHSFTVDFLTPAITPIFYGAEFYNAMQEDPEASLITNLGVAGRRSLNVLYNTTMLKSLNDAIAYSDAPDDVIATALTSYLGQFIPSALTNIANTVYKDRKDLSVKEQGFVGDLHYVGNRLLNIVPYARDTLPNKIEGYGDIAEQEGIESILMNLGLPENEAIGFVSRAIENFVLPTNVKEIKTDEVTDEILRLHREGDVDKILKISGNAPKDFTINKVKYKLDKKELSKAKELYGKTIKENLDILINSKAYKNIEDDAEKAEIINKIYDYARETVKVEYVSKKSLPYKSKNKVYQKMAEIKRQNRGNKEVEQYFNTLINEIHRNAMKNKKDDNEEEGTD